MGTIRLNKIHVHGFHGCMPEEALIGGDYEVDVILNTDFSEAAAEDDLHKTIDYVAVNNIVLEEMAKRSKLIETVAQAIANKLKTQFDTLDSGEVIVTKISPPMRGHVENVSVSVSF